MRSRAPTPLALALATLVAALAPALARGQSRTDPSSSRDSGAGEVPAPTRGAAPTSPTRETPSPSPSPSPSPGREAPTSWGDGWELSETEHPWLDLADESCLDPRGIEYDPTWPTTLEIRVTEPDDAVAPWTSFALTLFTDESHTRGARWSSPGSGATKVLWQVSTRRFGREFEHYPVGLLASGWAEGDEAGQFDIDFDHLLSTVPPPSPGAQPWDVELSMVGVDVHDLEITVPDFGYAELASGPRLYAVRVTPFDGSVRAGAPSNTVYVLIRDREETNPLVPFQPPGSPYQVEILSMTPIYPPTMSGDCVTITGIDHEVALAQLGPNYDRPGYPFNPIYRYFESRIGDVYCPDHDDGGGLGGFFDAFFDFLVTLASLPAEAYEELKEGFVEIVAEIWNATGGAAFDLECDEECQDLLVTGLEIGLASLGIPPQLPNAEELMDQGLDYLVAAAVEEAGMSCDDTCRDLIADGIQELGARIADQTAHSVSPGLPAWVVAEPYRWATLRPAVATLEITLDPTSPYDQTDHQAYLSVSFPGRNEYIVGRTVSVDCDFCEFDPSLHRYVVNEPIEGPMFQPVFLEIPPLRRGESLTLPIVLHATDFWLPGHEVELPCPGCIGSYNDWPYFYEGGEVTVQASVQCYAPLGNWDSMQAWQVCGGSDVRTATMPTYGGEYRL